MSSATSEKPMELEGNLASFQLPEILRFLAMGEMTGTLTLTSEERLVGLQIQEGQLVGIRSPDRHLKLGELLVYSGMLSRRELDDALASQNESSTGVLIGELLLERKVVTPQQMVNVLQLQIKEELWELFSWRNGSFKFEHGTLKTSERVTIRLEIEPLIDEGNQRMDQYQTIARNLGASDVRFRIRSDMKIFPESRINPGTWRVLSLINGKRSVQTLICLSGLGKFETLCSLDTLVDHQIIEQVESPTQKAKGRPTPDNHPAPRANITGNDAAPSENPNPSERTGLRSMLGFGRKSGGKGNSAENSQPSSLNPDTDSTRYYSSVSLACTIINKLFEDLADANLPHGSLTAIWEKACIRYPRTDLVDISDAGLDGKHFDGYARVAGSDERSLSGVHDDLIGALAATAQGVLQQAEESLGERAWTVAEACAQPYLDGVKVQWPTDYDIRDWVPRWLSRRN